MKKLSLLTLFLMSFQVASADVYGIDMNCKNASKTYSFSITNFNGATGVIETRGFYGGLTETPFEQADESQQVDKNFTVYTDEHSRKISISNGSENLDAKDETDVYFLDEKFTCTVN